MNLSFPDRWARFRQVPKRGNWSYKASGRGPPGVLLRNLNSRARPGEATNSESVRCNKRGDKNAVQQTWCNKRRRRFTARTIKKKTSTNARLRARMAHAETLTNRVRCFTCRHRRRHERHQQNRWRALKRKKCSAVQEIATRPARHPLLQPGREKRAI